MTAWAVVVDKNSRIAIQAWLPNGPCQPASGRELEEYYAHYVDSVQLQQSAKRQTPFDEGLRDATEDDEQASEWNFAASMTPGPTSAKLMGCNSEFVVARVRLDLVRRFFVASSPKRYDEQ